MSAAGSGYDARMRKIIHLSDLHTGYPDLLERFSCIVRNIIFLKEPASDYVVVISGDLVDNGSVDDAYDNVRRELDRLREAGFAVVACPGNHDYGTGLLGNKRNVDRFKAAFWNEPDANYPRLDVIDGCAFIGLDTLAEELNWYDRIFAQGELGHAQLTRLSVLLQSERVRLCTHRVIYMHHHPFDPRPLHDLKDSGALREVLQGQKLDALLYGHNHGGLIANGKWGISRCYDGGSATRKPAVDPRRRGSFHRVIDLTREPSHDYDARFDRAM